MSKHFKQSEFSCRCGCGFDNINPEIIEQLEKIRNIFNKSIIITSACRCEENNKKVGGVSNSQHLFGNATDFHVAGISSGKLHAQMKEILNKGIIRNLGLYSWGVHIDVRPDKHFWDNR